MIIECVPNVSEGRRLTFVNRMAATIAQTPTVGLLNHSADPSHNRSVFTFAGSAEGVEHAVLSMFDLAVAEIDLREHRGEHPRIGAIDVVPLVPIEGVTMEDCVRLARTTGAAVSTRYAIPVYLYEEAAARPERRHLENIRRGGFEGLAAKMAEPAWAPDFGPSVPHPTAGASVVGARMPLIAYNINLATDRLEVAKKIAATIRQSSGGFPFVKAMGVRLEHRQIVQVSMNLTNYQQTPMPVVFDAVKREAERYGVAVLESEIIGLVPAAALEPGDEVRLQLAGFKTSQILEEQLRRRDREARDARRQSS